MKKSIIILLLFCSYLSFAQGEEGRAITGRIQIDVGKIDTLYFTNDTLYLTEDGRLFKTEILVSSTPQTLSWNGGTGVISISDGNSIDIDGRYGQLSGTNTWTGDNDFRMPQSEVRITSTTTSARNFLYFYNNTNTQTGYLSGSPTSGLTMLSPIGLRLSYNSTRDFSINSNGIFGDFDTGTSSNVLYYDSSTDEITYGAAGGGGVSFGTSQQIPYMNGTNNDFSYSSNLFFDGTILESGGFTANQYGILIENTAGDIIIIDGLIKLDNRASDPTGITGVGQLYSKSNKPYWRSGLSVYDLTTAYSVNSGAPSSASDTGTTGEIRYDSNYIYICVATNTWKRAAISTW